jgi:AraC-like DNA-binding protein
MTMSVGSIPARYFVLLRDALAAQGVDTGELLRIAKVDPARFEQPDTRLPPAQVHDLVSAMRRLTGRSDLGFELGKLAKINTHDMLGYGLISCRTLDHMLQMGSRYYHLVNEVCTMIYRRHGARAEVVFSPIAALPLETLHFVLESIAVSLHNHVQMLLGPEIEGYDMRLSMPPPPHLSRYFGLAPARFEFDEFAVPGIQVRMDGRLLDKPLPLFAPHVVQQIEERFGPRVRAPRPGEKWGEFIAMMLRQGQGEQLTLDALAQRLKVSPRTLDRCLKSENVRFRDLSQKIRIETACRLLTGGKATVNEVALQLGFSDAANFSRAFRRFTGVTPTAYRHEAQARS